MMSYRLFYHDESPRRRLKVIDGQLIKEGKDFDVYHTEDDSVEAVKVSQNGSKDTILLSTKGSQESQICEVRVSHVREKDYNYEQYICGFGYWATSCEVGFYGETNRKIEHEWGRTCVSIGKSTEVIGESGFDNDWSWELKTEEPEVTTWIERGDITDAIGANKCVVVGSDTKELEPLDVFYRVSD